MEYKLTDHLGSTRMAYKLNFTCAAVYQNATIQYMADYYSFGKIVREYINPGTSAEKYQYTGKERDTESGFDYFNARNYHSEVGRFLSVDPMAGKYPSWSPYNYTMNNPIRFIDPDGMKVIFGKGVSEEFKKSFAESVQYLNKNGAGGMLKALNASDEIYYISESNKNSSFDPKTKTISWDPTSAVLTNELKELSPTTLLNHEIDHALQFDKNPKKQEKDGATPDPNYGNLEEKRVITGSEQSTAKKLGEIMEGEITRKDHGGTLYKTINSTSIKRRDEIIIKPEDDDKK